MLRELIRGRVVLLSALFGERSGDEPGETEISTTGKAGGGNSWWVSAEAILYRDAYMII